MKMTKMENSERPREEIFGLIQWHTQHRLWGFETLATTPIYDNNRFFEVIFINIFFQILIINLMVTDP